VKVELIGMKVMYEQLHEMKRILLVSRTAKSITIAFNGWRAHDCVINALENRVTELQIRLLLGSP